MLIVESSGHREADVAHLYVSAVVHGAEATAMRLGVHPYSRMARSSGIRLNVELLGERVAICVEMNVLFDAKGEHLRQQPARTIQVS